MKKTKKVTSVEKVYSAAVKLFKVGKDLPLSKIAEKTNLSMEWTRQCVLKLVDMKLVKRNKEGKIILVK